MSTSNVIPGSDELSRRIDQLSMRDMRILCLVSELKTISAAAGALEISQSSASYSLDKTRQIFDDPIFVSSGKRLFPTDVGRRLVSVSEYTIRCMNEAGRPTGASPKDLSGEVVILTRPHEWRWREKIAERFFETFPYGRLQFAATEDVNVDKFLTQQADFFVGNSSPVLGNVASHPFSHIPCRMVFNPKTVTPPDSVEAFSNCRFAVAWAQIGFEDRKGGVVDRALADLGAPPRTLHYKSHSLAAIANMLWQTDMIFTGPVHGLPDQFKGLSHAPLPFAANEMEIAVRWTEARRRSPLVSMTIDIAIEVLEEEFSLSETALPTIPYVA